MLKRTKGWLWVGLCCIDWRTGCSQLDNCSSDGCSPLERSAVSRSRAFLGRTGVFKTPGSSGEENVMTRTVPEGRGLVTFRIMHAAYDFHCTRNDGGCEQ